MLNNFGFLFFLIKLMFIRASISAPLKTSFSDTLFGYSTYLVQLGFG